MPRVVAVVENGVRRIVVVDPRLRGLPGAGGGVVPGVGLGVSIDPASIAMDGSVVFLSFPDPPTAPINGTLQTNEGYLSWDAATSTITVLAGGIYSIGFEVDIDGGGTGEWETNALVSGVSTPGGEGGYNPWGSPYVDHDDASADTSAANEFIRALPPDTTVQIYVSGGPGSTVVYCDFNIWRVA